MESQRMFSGVPASALAVPLVPFLHDKLLLVTPNVAETLPLPRNSRLSQLTIREAEGQRTWKVCYHRPEGAFLGGWPQLVRHPALASHGSRSGGPFKPSVHVRRVQLASTAAENWMLDWASN